MSFYEACQTGGCDDSACYTVVSPSGVRSRVCRRCMEELKAVYGYRLILGSQTVDTADASS